MRAPETKSVYELLGSATPEEVDLFLADLSDNTLLALPYLFEHWAHVGHQLPPDGDWHTWVLLGGRGAGKTRAGAEWVRSQVEGSRPSDPGRCKLVALVGQTLDQAREVMVFGESGIMQSTPPDRRPKWNSTRNMLEWPNGATAQIFSAANPESLRGPQFDCAWCDEFAKWKKAGDTWDMLQFSLRLGQQPQAIVTTTPRNNPALIEVLADKGTVLTRAPTQANRAHLAPGFVEQVTERYGNSRLGRQEISGEMLEDVDGALWTHRMIDACRLQKAEALDRVVVAIDPSVTSKNTSDSCGIIVAGVTMQGKPQDWRAFILEDGSLRASSPLGWARCAEALAEVYAADRIVAEVNQGGDLVENVLRQVNPMISYRGVRAARNKVARAEPVSALYEQGRVFHCGIFAELEDQMCQMTRQGFLGFGSPDRVDALVWALTDLMLEPAASFRRPQMRTL